jgi:hypothetical protein
MEARACRQIVAVRWIALAGALFACGSEQHAPPEQEQGESSASRLASAPASATVAAKPPRRTDNPELTRAVETLWKAYQLRSAPQITLMLAIAYERVDALAECRQLVDSIDESELPPAGKERLTRLRTVLEAREAGAPRNHDDTLDKEIITAARRFEQRWQEECCDDAR